MSILMKGEKMARATWQTRIVIDPELHHGDPCIKGTRIQAAMIVGSLADGMSFNEIQATFPQLTKAASQSVPGQWLRCR